MAKRKIIWSHRASIKLFKILDFYTERNKSRAYFKKLYQKFCKELSLLINHPNIGIRTEIEGVRGLIIDEFILFYEVSAEFVFIHTIWDCRQNPADLKVK